MNTATPFGPAFVNEMINSIINTAKNASKEVAREVAHLLWSAFLTFLTDHWLALMIIFFVVLVAATLKAAFGRWGTLGSVLYNSLYFGILFIVGLIWGPEIFVSDYVHAACTLILYPLCYLVVGLILDKIGVR